MQAQAGAYAMSGYQITTYSGSSNFFAVFARAFFAVFAFK
jgi:hypothetical protein